MMADDRFFPAPNDLNWSLNAALFQSPASQCQDDLDGHILTSAKCTAYCRVNDSDLFKGKIQRMSDLLLILMGPLPAQQSR